MSTLPDRQAFWPEDELVADVAREPPRRPVCGLAIAFCCGIALGLEFPAAVEALLLAGGLCAATALVWRRHAGADFLLAAGLLCAGWVHASLYAHSPCAREVAALLGRPAEYVSVIGEVRDAPTLRVDERTHENVWTFPLRIEGLRRIEAWQRAAGEVDCQFRLPADRAPPRFGERWLLPGLLGPHTRWRAGSMVPAGYRLAADEAGSRRLDAAGRSIYAGCLWMRSQCAVLLGRGLEGAAPEAGLLRAMMLGTREDMDEALYRDFSVTGTMHIIAVSGTHVAIMGLLLLVVLRACGVSQPYWFFWLAPLLALYTLMTGLAPSAIRACIMAVLFWGAPILQRRPDALTALAWSALLLLVWDPAQGRDIGFLLSYAAVLGLLLVYPPLAARAQRWLRADPWQVQEEARRRRWPRLVVRHLVLLALTSLGVCVVTDPLTARYFNLISPVALLANLAVVPAAGLMMVLGVLALVGGAVWAPLAEVFNSANYPVIWFIMHCTEWSAALPGGHFYVRTPGWFWIAAYYAALLLVLLGGARTRRVVALAVLLAGGVLGWRLAADRSLAVHVWRLGPTLVALVDAPGGDRVLVNTGPRFVLRDLVRRIHAEGVGELRALVLTRGNSDHAGGASNLLRQVAVRELWCAPEMAAQKVDPARLITRRLEAGLCVPLAGGAGLEVVYPPADLRTRRGEDRAAVFRLARGPVTMLFLNEAGAGAVAALQARHAVSEAAVVLAGNAAALEPAWLAALGVREVVTPGSLLRDVQDRQAAVEQGGVRLWRMEEGAVVHIVWPARTNAPPAALLTASPWSPIDPTTF